jgi:hypothetical protein
MRIDSPFPKGSPVPDRLHDLPGGFPSRRVAERSGALELSGLFSQLRNILILVFLDEDSEHVHE